jgi:cell division protein FtsL
MEDIYEDYRQQLIVTANVIPSSVILFTLMMETIRSAETSVLTRTTRHLIPEESSLKLKEDNGQSRIFFGRILLKMAALR